MKEGITYWHFMGAGIGTGLLATVATFVVAWFEDRGKQ